MIASLAFQHVELTRSLILKTYNLTSDGFGRGIRGMPAVYPSFFEAQIYSRIACLFAAVTGPIDILANVSLTVINAFIFVIETAAGFKDKTAEKCFVATAKSVVHSIAQTILTLTLGLISPQLNYYAVWIITGDVSGYYDEVMS